MASEARLTTLVLSWLAVAGVSAGVVWVSAFRPITEPTEADAVESSYELSLSEFADERTVEVTITPEAGQPLVSRAGGTITGLDCAPGGQWVQGSSPAAVNGQRILLLNSAAPWYRDLTQDDKGEDVANLQRAINALGAEVGVTGTFDSATRAAWKKVLTAADLPAGEGDFLLSQVVWLPEAEVTITECPLVVGQDVAAGEALAKAGSGRSTMTFTPPADLFDGPRTLTIGETSIALTDDLLVADPTAVDALLATPEVASAIQRAKGEAVQLSGRLRLAEPIPVHAVPPSSVVKDASGRVCVLSGGTPHAAEVVSSALGLSYVRIDGDPPSAVDAHPAKEATCGS
ncbi:hypothetical protein EII34_04780 [Arachnia propionica]|uniref:Peptidoglycan-binding protein n=1 Tax=Arachnia propionica TaxID=1750 RepID=A0A3P1T979_9ACTN|nr:hypothetical protein [Arachnia propionica]MDO5082729.1 hypothetical protein [Arachnia propionica]RRD06002.1 hypothetical protein EII34_04780 [Arachnia propionica]